MTQWNTRYVAYATIHGVGPEEMLAADDRLWPGGKMVGFVLWMADRWTEWEKPRPEGQRRPWATYCPKLSKEFDAWLSRCVATTNALQPDSCDRTCHRKASSL